MKVEVSRKKLILKKMTLFFPATPPDNLHKFAQTFLYFSTAQGVLLALGSDVLVNWVNRNEPSSNPENLRNGYPTKKQMLKNCIKFQVRRSFSPIIFSYFVCHLVVSLGAMDEKKLVWIL